MVLDLRLPAVANGAVSDPEPNPRSRLPEIGDDASKLACWQAFARTGTGRLRLRRRHQQCLAWEGIVRAMRTTSMWLLSVFNSKAC